jgi:hypothetical protein
LYEATESNNEKMAETENSVFDMSALQDQLDELNAQITKQGSHVRQLKKDGTGDAITEAVSKLQALKSQAAELTEKLRKDTPQFNRKAFDELILRKMFVVPSFEIHGGVKGLFDLGPPACGLKVRILFAGTNKGMHDAIESFFKPMNFFALSRRL